MITDSDFVLDYAKQWATAVWTMKTAMVASLAECGSRVKQNGKTKSKPFQEE
jgi:hypothetical protein